MKLKWYEVNSTLRRSFVFRFLRWGKFAKRYELKRFEHHWIYATMG